MKNKIDHNSAVNQEIKGKLVAREVYTCFSYEMDAILRKSTDYHDGLPTWDDIENGYCGRCPECGEETKTFDDGEYRCENEDCENHTGICDQEPQEIFEWWIISEWLYEKLRAKGQPVLVWGNNYYWGRLSTGQAILLDGVISEIAEEMEILGGQKYDWGSK